jgi:uncharacterized membrane protein YgcG
MRAARLLVVGAVVAAAVLGTAAAATADQIPAFDIVIRVQSDGSMLITETIEYTFDAGEHHGIYRDVATRRPYDDVDDRVTPVSDVSASAPDVPDDVDVEQEGAVTRIRIGDPDVTVSGTHTYTVSYRVDGAMNGFEDHDELYWNATGDAWVAAIDATTVRVVMPGRITRVACYQGPTGSTEPCGRAVAKGATARFTAGRLLYPGEGLTFVVAVPKGVVAEPVPILEERWSFGRRFAVTSSSVGLAAAVLVLAGFWVIRSFVRSGRDRRYRGSQIDQVMGSATGEEEAVPVGDADTSGPVEFAPPGDLRPAYMGLLLEERVRTLHVTATIVDLAVRGYLHINEVDGGFLRKHDWELVQGTPPDEHVPRYERILLDGLFAGRSTVRVSELRNTFAPTLKSVEEAVAKDGMTQRWFVENPDDVRGRWSQRAVLVIVLGVVATFLLARYTHLAIAGLAVILAGVVLAVTAGRMPSRTAKGTAFTRRIRGFRTVVETADRYLATWAEQEHVFTRYLAYAVLFGVTDRWAKAFAQIGVQDDVATFYTGTRPFVMGDFSHAIDGFAVTTGGTLSSTPGSSGSSGFGGGGFSGGGGGGGGGGSW